MQNYILVYKTRLLAQIIANHTEDNKSISPAGRQRNISSAQLLLAVRTWFGKENFDKRREGL